MAALTRTFTQLLVDLRYLADIEDQTDRHPDARLEHLLNQGWRELVELLNESGAGGDYTTATGNCTASQAYITRPTDLVWLAGLDITDGDETHSLQPMNLLQRNEWGSYEGVPVAFTVQETTKIHLYPTPDTTYAYTAIYLAYEAVKTGASTVDTINGWEDYVITYAALRVLTRDDDDEQFQKVFALHQGNEQRVKRAASKRLRVGPAKRLDTRGMRRRQERLARD